VALLLVAGDFRQQFVDLVLFVACFAKNVNLVSFVLGQTGVVHWGIRLGG
jgi:hypothetical protein